jgi:signal transduction histidine kinase
MTLRTKIVALVLGLTVSILVGLGLFLAGSWAAWSREAVERDLSERAEALAALVEVKEHGGFELEDEGAPLLEDPAHPYRILLPGGLEYSSGDLAWPSPGERHAIVRDRLGHGWRVVSRVLQAGHEERHHRREGVRITVQVAGLEAPFGTLEERFRQGLLLALLAAFLLGGGGAALLAHLSLAPLRRVASEVDAIGASSLDRRVGTAGLDRELARLASAFNDLLGRLDEAMQRQRALVSRASHALRTPAATILTRAEVALRRERPAPEYRAALTEIASAARESAELVDHLLTLARLEERRSRLRLEDVSLPEVAAELVRLLGPRAEEAGIALECDVPPDLSVIAERAALRELLEALLDNAIQYTPRGGRAGIRAKRDPGGVTLIAWDTGPGIPLDERPHVFDRFRRGSAAQASGMPGTGLGLAIVKAIAEAHGATLSLGDRQGGGLEVAVLLPRSRTPAPHRTGAAPGGGRHPEAGWGGAAERGSSG